MSKPQTNLTSSTPLSAAAAVQTSPSAKPPRAPLPTYFRGWRSQLRDVDYWIPEADIEGTVPPELFGTFLRNGPGINEVYGSPLKHPIDGDGMVVAVSFVNGKVHLRSRFVQTRQRVEESRARRLVFKGQMGTTPETASETALNIAKSVATFSMPKIQWRDPSNTNVVYWGGKILSMYETKLPHTLDPYSLDTLGKDNLGGVLSAGGAMAAHFRLDTHRDRMVTISVRPALKQPFLGVYEWDPHWNLCQKREVSIPGLNYSHDFVLTENYYVFHMSPFVKVNKAVGLKIALGLTSPGEDMRYHSDLPSRMVVIPRDPNSTKPILQLDTIPCHIYHFSNASERVDVDGKVHIDFIAVCLPTNMTMAHDGYWLANGADAPGRVHQFHLSIDPTHDAKLSKCEAVLADHCNCEFPTAHPYRNLAPCRFAYLMASDRKEENYSVPFSDVVKFDTLKQERQVWYSHGSIGEPVFVPRTAWYPGTKPNMNEREDDGWVITQLYNPKTALTEFIVLDASDLGKGPIARIKLHHHIPYGFHGTFTPHVFVSPPLADKDTPDVALQTARDVRARARAQAITLSSMNSFDVPAIPSKL